MQYAQQLAYVVEMQTCRGFIQNVWGLRYRVVSVRDAIEDTQEEAENMKLRSSLMMALKAHIIRTGLSQSEAAKLFGSHSRAFPI
jgi:hypothetical protein